MHDNADQFYRFYKDDLKYLSNITRGNVSVELCTSHILKCPPVSSSKFQKMIRLSQQNNNVLVRIVVHFNAIFALSLIFSFTTDFCSTVYEGVHNRRDARPVCTIRRIPLVRPYNKVIHKSL